MRFYEGYLNMPGDGFTPEDARILMKNGEWLVPPRLRPAIAPPPVEVTGKKSFGQIRTYRKAVDCKKKKGAPPW